MRELELLIPARDLSAGMAAVDHGADAVYIGGPAFGARAAAGNAIEDIGRLAEYAHRWRVKVYAALNTLLYGHELSDARAIATDLVSAGADALIIQDPAYLMMGIGGAVFHASTQMTNMSVEKAAFLAANGFSRVVLERGLTLGQIADISRRGGVETEVFIHGAICVGYSGRCYLSRSMGPRSGNRGDCAQPCRLAYDLEDETGRKLMTDKHLLSVRDLNLSGRVGDLIDAGVTSFKVEGRLKDELYVKNITSYYRKIIDREIATRPAVRRSSDGQSEVGFLPDPAKTYTRGYTTWMLDGPKKGEGSFDIPKAVGEMVGKVVRTGDGWFEVCYPCKEIALAPGDGIYFLREGVAAGSNVNRVQAQRIYPNRMDGVSAGVPVYRNYDKAFADALKRSQPVRTIPVTLGYRYEGLKLIVQAVDPRGTRAETAIEGCSGPAKDPVRMTQTVKTQLGKAGGSEFSVIRVNRLGPAEGEIPFFRVSELNGLRRRLLEALRTERHWVWAREKSAERESHFPDPVTCDSGDVRPDYNVTNTLSARFWRERGYVEVEKPFDQRPSLQGEVVMVTPYCLRRESGLCLTGDNPDYRGPLFLRHGEHKYELRFDCRNCRMELKEC